MPETKGVAWVPTPDEVARVSLLHADMLSRVKRFQDCADKLDGVLSNLEVSLAMREEAGRRILLCADKLKNAGAEGRAMSLLDSVQRDETLDPPLREKADQLLLRISTEWSFRLNDLGKLGKSS